MHHDALIKAPTKAEFIGVPNWNGLESYLGVVTPNTRLAIHSGPFIIYSKDVWLNLNFHQKCPQAGSVVGLSTFCTALGRIVSNLAIDESYAQGILKRLGDTVKLRPEIATGKRIRVTLYLRVSR